MSDASPMTPPAKKRRPPPRAVRVQAIDQITPGVVRVTFEGPELASFETTKPGEHMKLLFVPPDAVWPPPEGVEAPRPPSRTYTPRRYHADSQRLEVEFVLHGPGMASDWVQIAKAGDRMLVGGPGGGHQVPTDVRNVVLIADDTAAPAAGMMLESLPAGCSMSVLCEIENAAEERPLSPNVDCKPIWLHRGPTKATPGTLLEAAVAALPAQPPDTFWWVACEAGAMRRIRDALAQTRGVARANLVTRGYWKLGDQNYPDHDYGAD